MVVFHEISHGDLPSGKRWRTWLCFKIHHWKQWENSIFPWPFSSSQIFQWKFEIPKMGCYVSTIFLAIFSGDILWNLGPTLRPDEGGSYLQFLGSWNGHWLLDVSIDLNVSVDGISYAIIYGYLMNHHILLNYYIWRDGVKGTEDKHLDLITSRLSWSR